jgi:hypothetical protein
MFHLPYDQVPLMPVWLSAVVVAVAVTNLVLMRRPQAS